MAQNIVREFNLCVLGSEGVGKTSLCSRLCGVPFNRKSGHKASMESEATRYSIEVLTSSGNILVHLYDWAWEQKRREQSINQQLMRGSDGAVFVFDVTDRKSKNDFDDYLDWYQRSAGFDKPWIIVSNKNDQKKRAVQEGEGQSLASRGDRRAYVPISLVDDVGIDDVALSICRIMLQDLNATLIAPPKAASEDAIKWSEDNSATKMANIGLSVTLPKSKRVILVVLNSAVIEKFTEALADTEFMVEPVGSPGLCEELLSNPSEDENAALPVVAIMVPPTASKSQQDALLSLATAKNIKFLVSIPRNAADVLKEL